MTERAIIVGDSQAGGLQTPLSELLRPLEIKIVATEHHIGQQTIWFARERIVKQLVDRYRPDLTIIVMGGNDAQRNFDTWLSGIQSVVAQAKSRSARVIWISPAFSERSDVQERHARIANWQEMSLPHLGVTWINSMPMTQGGHSGDGVHFTRAGYRAWAESVADELATLSKPFPWVPVLSMAIVGYLFVKTAF